VGQRGEATAGGRLVGRDSSSAQLEDELGQAARSGRAGAVLVSGEAGVGKTSLVHAACTTDGIQVLWCSCPPMTSLNAPFLPLRSGFQRWAAVHPDSALPVLDLPSRGQAGDVALALDTWLGEASRTTPLVMVVDDVQWADVSTRDVLRYVLAGLGLGGERPLSILITVRTGEEPDDELHSWLADVRRLPGVDELRLDRLDRVATAEQLADLLHGPPFESLVDSVYERSRGNPYLTRLLVRNLSVHDRTIPGGMADDLEDAVTRLWRGLSSPARQLAALVAVGGRPQPGARIAAITTEVGLPGDVVTLLREAVDAGVLGLEAGDRYWFAHPLTPEVLVRRMLPEERRQAHAAFVSVLVEEVGLGSVGLDRTVNLADHYFGAGDLDKARAWAVRAAEASGRAGGTAESIRLLRRVLEIDDLT
jgi:hypothetical protein